MQKQTFGISLVSTPGLIVDTRNQEPMKTFVIPGAELMIPRLRAERSDPLMGKPVMIINYANVQKHLHNIKQNIFTSLVCSMSICVILC